MGFLANNGGMTLLVCFPSDVKRSDAAEKREERRRQLKDKLSMVAHTVQSHEAQVCVTDNLPPPISVKLLQ